MSKFIATTFDDNGVQRVYSTRVVNENYVLATGDIEVNQNADFLQQSIYEASNNRFVDDAGVVLLELGNE